MSKHPIDLAATRQTLAQFAQDLTDCPELGRENPERRDAFQEWQQAHQQHRRNRTMPRKPTGRPRGRPKNEAGYTTLMARVPLPLATRVKAYAHLHHQKVSELIRDCLEWRLNTEAAQPSVAPATGARRRTKEAP